MLRRRQQISRHYSRLHSGPGIWHSEYSSAGCEAANNPMGGVPERKYRAKRDYHNCQIQTLRRCSQKLPNYEMQCVDCHNTAGAHIRTAGARTEPGDAVRRLPRHFDPTSKRRAYEPEEWNTQPVMRQRAGYGNHESFYATSLCRLCRRAGRRTLSRQPNRAGGLQSQRFSRAESELGNLSEQSRAHRFPWVFPLVTTGCSNTFQSLTRTQSRRTARSVTKRCPLPRHRPRS